MDSEYELWQTENQYSADADTLLAKKTENAAAEIANQTDRVAIAQAKSTSFIQNGARTRPKPDRLTRTC